MAAAQPQVGQASGVKGLRLSLRNQAKVSMLAGVEGALPVVDFGHGATESPDIDGGFGDFTLQTSVMKQGKHFLGFAHGKDWNENGTAPLKSLANTGKESVLKKGTILARNGGLSAPRRFHNQSVERSGRVLAGKHEGLALKIEVAGVESTVLIGPDFSHDRSRHVASVVEHEFEIGGVDSDGPVQVGQFPSYRAVIHAAVSIKRVIGAAQFTALAGHDVDGIVQKRFRQGSGAGGHEYFCAEVCGGD